MCAKGRSKGQAVLLATLIMFVVAAVGAGFILFVQNSMTLSQRARQEEEALLLARAGLLFADRQLTEKGADWRPSIMVAYDEFERSRGWHRPDKENDWYGKYAVLRVTDLLGSVQGAGGSFLLKVKYLPEQQVLKIISIGRPAPNSPVFRRLVAYKPIPSDWIWTTAQGDDPYPDPLLLRLDVDDDGNLNAPEYSGRFVRLGQVRNWRLQVDPNINRWVWLNAERDPLVATTPPGVDPQRLQWLRLRSWFSPTRLPIRDELVVFTSTIRTNSDLLWYGLTPLQVTNLFGGSVPLVEVARRIQHADDDGDFRFSEDDLDGTDNDGDGRIDEDPLTWVLVYDSADQFQPSNISRFLGGAAPSNFGVPPGTGFVFFPIGGIPRYLDGWERLGGLLPVRWAFNFERRTVPRVQPIINLRFYYAQTRDANPPTSHFGYFALPNSLNVRDPAQDPNNALPGFYTVRNDLDNPNQPLIFRGIYIDNTSDQQFVDTAPDVVDDDNNTSTIDPDPQAFVDNNNEYRPELAQVYDWLVKPAHIHARRLQWDSGWYQDEDDPQTTNVNESRNERTERNLVEVRDASGNPLPITYRFAAPHLYVPPGVEVRFDVVPVPNTTRVLQRVWLIRHDDIFRAPDGSPLSNRLAFVDLVQLGQFDADNDGRFGEDPLNNRDDDGDGFVDEDPAPDADSDGRSMEDPINFRDDDGDGLIDEDPPHTAHINNQLPQIVLVAEGNIRVSGQVAVSVKLVTPETIYVEGALYPITSNATIELLAKRNVCLNFAAARTPLPIDGLNPATDRSTLLPRWRLISLNGFINAQNAQALQGVSYTLPNLPDPLTNLFADQLQGSIGGLLFPAPQDRNGDRLVDAADANNNPLTAQAVFALTGASLPLSIDLLQNFQQLLNRTWTLRLVLLHRGLNATQDPNNPNNWQGARNPWTDLQVHISFDDDNDGRLDEDPTQDGTDNDNDGRDGEDPINAVLLYGPSEPMRTFPAASRWYYGDGRPIALNDPTTQKEWGILDIPIPPNIPGLLVDRDGDNALTPNDLRLSLQLMRVVVTSPVAGEVIPQGRVPVRYELAGLKLALYDEQGIPRPIWQATPDTFFVLASAHAERGTVGFVPTDYFDPTAHPSWQLIVNRIANLPPLQRDQWRATQRMWSLYYLRHNSVRWTNVVDPNALPPAIGQQLFFQSVPVLAGQIIQRVSLQTMLWRIANQLPSGVPFRPDALRFGMEIALDKLALPYWADLDPPNRLADLLNFNRPIPPIFVEVPRAMFASAWLWSWRAANPTAQGVLNFGGAILPPFYRTTVTPNLRLGAGYFAVYQQQVGED